MAKQTLINQKANKKLKELFFDKDITTCEIGLEGCLNHSFLGFAHRHKRIWYYNKPEKLWDFNEVCLACVSCHLKLENNKELTKITFAKLRKS